MFAHVWEGAVLVGTTDVDHPVADVPPTISPAEADYLVEALRLPFPQLRLDAAQALSTFAGLRAIVVPPGEAHLPPSAMGRDSALWTRPGLVGITGGKLTTHRATAAEVLREVEAQGLRAGAASRRRRRPARRRRACKDGSASPARPGSRRGRPRNGSRSPARPTAWPSCAGRCARSRCAVSTTCCCAAPGSAWWRRDGGESLLPMLEAPCREDLGWDAARWADEAARYRAHWAARHAPPAQNRRS